MISGLNWMDNPLTMHIKASKIINTGAMASPSLLENKNPMTNRFNPTTHPRLPNNFPMMVLGTFFFLYSFQPHMAVRIPPIGYKKTGYMVNLYNSNKERINWLPITMSIKLPQNTNTWPFSLKRSLVSSIVFDINNRLCSGVKIGFSISCIYKLSLCKYKLVYSINHIKLNINQIRFRRIFT